MEGVTETTNLRQNLPDGGVIRHDEGTGFWIVKGTKISMNGAFYGTPPKGWNRQYAFYENYSRYYEGEFDYE